MSHKDGLTSPHKYHHKYQSGIGSIRVIDRIPKILILCVVIFGAVKDRGFQLELQDPSHYGNEDSSEYPEARTRTVASLNPGMCRWGMQGELIRCLAPYTYGIVVQLESDCLRRVVSRVRFLPRVPLRYPWTLILNSPGLDQ
jgi:hypothetical protein